MGNNITNYNINKKYTNKEIYEKYNILTKYNKNTVYNIKLNKLYIPILSTIYE